MARLPDTAMNPISQGVVDGLKKGWSGLLWLLKILVPVSLLTALLVHFGLIQKMDFLLTPFMAFLSLPPQAAVVILIGIFTGIYGTVAALSVMSFSMNHMILIAVFTLIAHNLIQESMVQEKSGLNGFVAGFFRLFAAIIVTFFLAKILGASPEETSGVVSQAVSAAPQNFSAMLLAWFIGTAKLCVQIFAILMPLMVVLQLAKVFKVIDVLTQVFAPVIRLMGLDRPCAMLWLTAAFFGLAYGAAVLVEETKLHEFDKESLTKLHLSIGVNHAMIEDPALFLPLGISAFWLWVPRLVAAVLIAYLFSVFSAVRRRYAQQPGH